MIYLLLIGFALAFVFSITFRTLLLHLPKTVFYLLRDGYRYLRYRRWNECPTGLIRAFIGLFGKGKTLSAVHYVVSLFRQYNDKPVYDFKQKKWLVQKIHIISNVELLGIPYEKFVSLSQIVKVSNDYREKDLVNGTRTIHLVLGDEFSVQMNSRKFKDNIDAFFLNTLLTCRHHHISLFYTAQRFGHVDALLRQVTSDVIECGKSWRVMVWKKYDAYELENCSNPLLIRPLARSGWFISDKDFEAYDTLACVDNLSKSCSEGDMLTEEQILALQRATPTDMESITNPSRKYLRKSRK